MPLLSIRDLVVRFRTHEATIYAVNGVSLDIAPHWALIPGGAIFFTVLSINFIGDGLRDALDPHYRG